MLRNNRAVRAHQHGRLQVDPSSSARQVQLRGLAELYPEL
jgi:hypothetical protein